MIGLLIVELSDRKLKYRGTECCWDRDCQRLVNWGGKWVWARLSLNDKDQDWWVLWVSRILLITTGLGRTCCLRAINNNNNNSINNNKPKRIEKIYNLDTLQKAIDSILEGQTLRQAADTYSIPKSTLHEIFKMKSVLECHKGPPPVLSWKTENEIVNWIIICQEKEFPVDKSRLLDCIQQYVK